MVRQENRSQPSSEAMSETLWISLTCEFSSSLEIKIVSKMSKECFFFLIKADFKVDLNSGLNLWVALKSRFFSNVSKSLFLYLLEA